MEVTNGSGIDQEAKLCQVCIQILMWSIRQRSTSHYVKHPRRGVLLGYELCSATSAKTSHFSAQPLA